MAEDLEDMPAMEELLEKQRDELRSVADNTCGSTFKPSRIRLRGRRAAVVYDSYIEVLAEALQTNRCMETLNLTPVVMTVDRAITIAEALDPNTIIAVKFHDNNEEAKRAFAKRMKKKRRASESSMPPTTPPPSLKQTAEVVALTRKLRKQESRIEKFEQEYAILEEENGELCDAKEELESDNHGLRQANATLKKKQQSIQKELSATTASLQDAQCQIAELEKQMEALREKLQEAVDNATHLESRNEQLLKDAALLAENTKLKGDWESKLEGVLNLNIPSSRFANKVPVFDIRGKPIGGAFGMLHRAELAGQPVALKQLFVVERPRLSDILASIDGAEDVPDHVKQMRREALVLLSLRHPNIVHFLGLTHDEVNHMLAFVLSWAENGSLFDLLHVKKHTLDKPARARIALEIVSAMAFLHAHNVVHRDLKSPNVLLDASLSAKVTDLA